MEMIILLLIYLLETPSPKREFGPPAMTLPAIVHPPRPKINYFCDDDIIEMHGDGIISEPIPCTSPVDCDGMFDRQSDRYQRCQLTL